MEAKGKGKVNTCNTPKARERQSDVCKCGHSRLIHVVGCFKRGCPCREFMIRAEGYLNTNPREGKTNV